jgi:hypothetical protein
MNPNVAGVHPQHALAVYVEALALGRRVAVLGDASLGLGARIAELGARSVCVWDPDPERAQREAERTVPGVTVRPLPPDDSDEPDGAFDLAIVADLELFEDAEGVLAYVRRLVGDEGAALVAARNRDATSDPAALDYYELFDLVAREFDDVTMIAQLPFYGLALAELGEKEEGEESPPVSVDTQLVAADRTPEVFVALASQRGLRLDPYAIVELGPPPRPSEGVAEVESARVALEQAQLRIEVLEAHAEDLHARFADAQHGARNAPKLEEALRDRLARVAELEGALVEGTRQVEALASRTASAERSLEAVESELTRVTDSHASEIARYEDALRERAQTIRVLEADLLRQERMVRDLVDTLEESAQASVAAPIPEEPLAPEPEARLEETAQLRRKLDTLALELARREGESQASTWRIAELESRLEALAEAAPSPDGPATPEPRPDATLERRLATALDELDVLRRALAQEHEARVHAESSEKPAPTHAEAHRQD